MCIKLLIYFIFSTIVWIPLSMAASELNYDQVMTGFDGPNVEKPGVIIIESEKVLMEHWISEKLGESKTKALIRNVDFSSQFIAVVQIGIRNTATGNMDIAEIEYNESKENVIVYVRVGVNELDCEIPKRRSLPYAIGVIDKPEVWPALVSYYVGNFGDGCKQPLGIEFKEI